MTSIWDELWKEMPRILDEDVLHDVSRAFFIRVKAEGDRLKEKAEKWDKYVGTGTLHDLIELKDKLEAIKTHRAEFRHSSYIEWLRELDKMLEI